MTPLVVAGGMTVMVGLWLTVVGLVGTRPRPPRPRPRRAAWWTHHDPRTRRRVLLVAGGALLGLVVTRWPVGALLGGLLGAAWPALLGAARARARRIARIQAVAEWTEMLRDLMTAASGLEEAIMASARADVVPGPIRAEVTTLAARLANRQPLRAALQAFADELADPAADRVVVALALAREQQVKQLGELLGAQARSTREHVDQRLRIEAERAKPRASARLVTAISLATLGVLLLFSRGWLAPYATPLGQLAALGIGGLFAAAFAWMSAMQREPAPLRLRLADPATATAAAADVQGVQGVQEAPR